MSSLEEPSVLSRLRHPMTTIHGVYRELSAVIRLADDWRSMLRLSFDVVLFRLLRLGRLPTEDRRRQVNAAGGTHIYYRLNRGDIQSIREVYVDETYCLPFCARPAVVVDLGANIGLASLYLARRYGCSVVVAVEPVASNAQLTSLNLSMNGVQARVVEAAVGPHDGWASFQGSRSSNLGRLGPEGTKVPLVSMNTVLELTPHGRVDLLKLDIEGGEGPLLDGDVSWLEHVGAIVAELHPQLGVDVDQLFTVLDAAGFRRTRSGPWSGAVESFVRDEWSWTGAPHGGCGLTDDAPGQRRDGRNEVSGP